MTKGTADKSVEEMLSLIAGGQKKETPIAAAKTKPIAKAAAKEPSNKTDTPVIEKPVQVRPTKNNSPYKAIQVSSAYSTKYGKHRVLSPISTEQAQKFKYMMMVLNYNSQNVGNLVDAFVDVFYHIYETFDHHQVDTLIRHSNDQFDVEKIMDIYKTLKTSK